MLRWSPLQPAPLLVSHSQSGETVLPPKKHSAACYVLVPKLVVCRKVSINEIIINVHLMILSKSTLNERGGKNALKFPGCLSYKGIFQESVY